MKPLIEVQNVTHEYHLGKVRVRALEDISLTIRSGEKVAFVGPSGSGKTTLINLIGRLDSPSEGKIFVDGEDITTYSARQSTNYRKTKVSFVFQFFNLISTLSVYENVEFPLLFRSVDAGEVEKRVREALRDVGLEGYENRMINELSGGQRQRVAIARAIVMQPRVILADEPTANLDGRTALQIIDLFSEVNKRFGTTVIFSTHDPRIMDRAERLVRLQDGRLVQN